MQFKESSFVVVVVVVVVVVHSREESPARKDAGDLEATLATHRKHQEQIAEDMILLARQMKNAHRAIQKTIKDDKEVCYVIHRIEDALHLYVY